MSNPLLDQWLARRTGGASTPESLAAWQLEQVRRTVDHARENSPFYARRLAHAEPQDIATMDDLAALPVTRPEDLQRDSDAFLCVSRDEIARIVTLRSSGTTGEPKRIFHTQGDLERTVDYFAHGMGAMTRPGQGVLVLLPGTTQGGVARLLGESLERLGARPELFGPLEYGSSQSVDEAVDHILVHGVHTVVGSPAHVNVLARAWQRRGLGRSTIESVLLCWDSVFPAVVRNVEQAFGCRALEHWGMVETGLGGAVSCAPGSGMHVRAADILVQVANPETGANLPDGQWGEIVVTTLSRRGMPLIRYATGDRGRLLPGSCPCGHPAPRLDRISGRLCSALPLGKAATLEYGVVANAVYGVDGVADFSVQVVASTPAHDPEHAPALRVGLSIVPGTDTEQAMARACAALKENGLCNVEFHVVAQGAPAEPGLAKRRITNANGIGAHEESCQGNRSASGIG